MGAIRDENVFTLTRPGSEGIIATVFGVQKGNPGSEPLFWTSEILYLTSSDDPRRRSRAYNSMLWSNRMNGTTDSLESLRYVLRALRSEVALQSSYC